MTEKIQNHSDQSHSESEQSTMEKSTGVTGREFKKTPDKESSDKNNGVDVITFGCRLNAQESQIIREHALKAGLKKTVIINTCAVTGEAVRQARQTIRKMHRQNPESHIVVTGCAAQIDPEHFAKMPEVSYVLGNVEKLSQASYQGLANFDNGQTERVQVNDIMSIQETAHHLVKGQDGRVRSFVQIQNGCNHRCTFCVIPYGRGNARSVPMGAVIDQIKLLVDSGCLEVVLTGVDLTAYGVDLPQNPSLGKLVQKILHHVPALPRLRLSSLDSIEIDTALFDVITGEKRVMPHVHLSLQAGDNMILKRMKRRHLREHSIEFCQKVRSYRPDIVFGADIIAGFPTETDEMFENSLRLVEECGLVYLHVFPYSPRPQTPAAKMPQLPRHVIKERAWRLREKGKSMLHAYFACVVDRVCHILIEKDGFGHTEHFTPAHVSGGGKVGDIVQARIVDYSQQALIANPH